MESVEARDRRKRQIVVSLPVKHGEVMKAYLQDLADRESRSLSNQVAWILKTWINDHAPYGWDMQDEESDQPEPTATESVEDLEAGLEEQSDQGSSKW